MSYIRPEDLGPSVRAAPATRIVPIAKLASEGRWRVEAMRSYDRPVLIWFTRGQGRITAAGVKRGYGPHNAIFLPPGTMHGFDTIGQVFGSIVHLPRSDTNPWPVQPVHLRIREGQAQAEMTALVDAIERETKGDLPGRDRAIASAVGMMSVWLERNVAAADDFSASAGSPAARRVATNYTRLLEVSFQSSRGVADYAADLGVTPTHLTRCCRDAAGRTAHDLLTDRKLFEARQLLTETRLPVTKVAEQLGFRSAAYFTRAFKTKTGQSPSAFRTENQT